MACDHVSLMGYSRHFFFPKINIPNDIQSRLKRPGRSNPVAPVNEGAYPAIFSASWAAFLGAAAKSRNRSAPLGSAPLRSASFGRMEHSRRPRPA